MQESFGEFAQVVLRKLVENHQWDDPYGAMSPANDPEGKIFNILLKGWNEKAATAVVAYRINEVLGKDTKS